MSLIPPSRYVGPRGIHRSRGSSELKLSQTRPLAHQSIDRSVWTDHNGDMVTFEIRTEGRTRTVEGVDALVAAVRSGKVGRAARVRAEGVDEWMRADEVPEVAALFSSAVWSAWEGEVDESVLDAFQAPETPKVPSLDPSVTLPPVDRVEELPEAAVAPVGAAEEAEEAEVAEEPIAAEAMMSEDFTPSQTTHPIKRRRPPAKVIEFPGGENHVSSGSHALDLRRQQGKAEHQVDGHPIRWMPIFLLGSVGLAVMLMWVWYVNMHATADFVPKANTVATKASIPEPMTPEVIAEVVSPYDTLEDELREQLMEGLLDITGESEFEDALLIELRRVRVDVRSVRVKISSWAGRNNDLPDEVGFNLKVVANDGELDRDLGALGLVLGKYIQHYGLQTKELNIILSADDGMRKIQMNPEMSRRYFTHRLSLERFLSSAFSGPE